MTIQINPDTCIRCGSCMSVSDQIKQKDDGTVYIAEQPQTDEQKQAMETAKSVCPTSAFEETE